MEKSGTDNNTAGEDDLSPWPNSRTSPVTFLLDARDEFEAGLLREWVISQAPASAHSSQFVKLPRGDREELLEHVSDQDESTWMQPLRIAWLPPKAATDRQSIVDSMLGRFGEPGLARRRWLARFQPERMAYIAGDGAQLAELRERLSRSDDDIDDEELSEFVANQALIALERTERSVRGARYKVPRIRHTDVFANRDYRNFIADTAQQRDTSEQEILDKAIRYLHEMAAMQTPFTLDLMNSMYRIACSSHHHAQINVLPEQLAQVADTMSHRPVVFLISHKSMLDSAALSLTLFEADLPLPLTFGGINLNTPGVGALARRSGVIFLRRSFQDNAIYKATFRRYIDYLIEKRFSLMWALEGTRSRTGKLMPPRYGLFNYVVESILRTQLYDVTFIPVSVAYDQITEVEDYSIEQRGQEKKPEGISWPMKFLRSGKSRGQIHLRFGEALTVRDLVEPDALEAGIDREQKQILVPTLAFEVAVRMNAATPITATSIIMLLLLAGGNRAQSMEQIQRSARAGMALMARRNLEVVGRADFDDEQAILATLHELHETDVVEYHDDGTDRLYAISKEQYLNAAYYRNTAIHYFVLDAFVEISLLSIADEEDSYEAFHEKAWALRELFKFEFYMPRSADYRSEVDGKLRDRVESPETLLAKGDDAIRQALREIEPLAAHGTLRSFVDAYRVAAIVLESHGDDAIDKESDFLAKCLKTGKQRLLQGRVFSAESVSKSLYATAYKLADYRGLLAANQAGERKVFLDELRGITKILDDILGISLARAEEGQ